MTELEMERIYTIPLRKVKAGSRNKMANRAVREVREFLTRHMKSEDVWLDAAVNEAIWARGMYTVPSKLRVRAVKFDDGVVEVSLPEEEATTSIRSTLKEEREAKAPILAREVEEEDLEEAAEEAGIEAVPEGDTDEATRGGAEGSIEAEPETAEIEAEPEAGEIEAEPEAAEEATGQADIEVPEKGEKPSKDADQAAKKAEAKAEEEAQKAEAKQAKKSAKEGMADESTKDQDRPDTSSKQN